MEKIYEVKGILPRGFVGQISYTVCLDYSCSALDIAFIYPEEKRVFRREELTDEVRRNFMETCLEKYGPDEFCPKDEEELDRTILSNSKSEIHTVAYMNDVFIGGIHRQLDERHMVYRDGTAGEGCIPQSIIEGVIKVTLIVFNVIKDETPYTLSLSVERSGDVQKI